MAAMCFYAKAPKENIAAIDRSYSGGWVLQPGHGRDIEGLVIKTGGGCYRRGTVGTSKAWSSKQGVVGAA